MERFSAVCLFFVLCAPGLASAGNHAFEILRTANQHYQGFDFFVIEARLPADGLSASENWCRDYQNLCSDFGLRPTGCGERYAVNGIGGDSYVRCVTEYNSDPYINNVLGCNAAGRVAEVANLAFSAGATWERSFGFHECATNDCQRGIVESQNSLHQTRLAFPGDRIVYTVCRGSATACASSPCRHGGTCQNQGHGYTCSCIPGYTGNNCETVLEMGACYQFSAHAASYDNASRSCGAEGGFLADVRKAEQQHFIGNVITAGSDVSHWIGIKVPPVTLTYSDGSSVSHELEWASSEPATPCDLCVLLDSSSNYQAITTSCGEQHNYVCQAEPKPCGQNICHNGGNCSSCFDWSYNFCTCLDGFDGKFCEINIDECASSPCQNGGSCTDGVNSFSCDCAIGYSGDFCGTDIDWCAQGQGQGYCPFGWICEDQVTHFICHATSNNMKSLYQCSSDTCPNGMTCISEGPGSFSCRAG